jgi:hypothetical protein
MQLKAIISALCLLGSAVALPTHTQEKQNLQVRQWGASPASTGPPPIEITFRNAGNALEGLQKELRSWRNLRGGDIQKVVRQAEALQKRATSEVHNGAREIRRGPYITPGEAYKMGEWANAFSDLVVDTMELWISNKRIVNQVNARQVILNELKDFAEALISFSDASNSRVSVASLTTSITNHKKRQATAVENAIKDYSRA